MIKKLVEKSIDIMMVALLFDVFAVVFIRALVDEARYMLED